MSNIFADEAPKYWSVGLPAIPLIKEQKRPAIGRWQLYADAFPTEDERNVWVNAFEDGNIGLPMGASSGLVAIDIDTDEPKIIAALDSILPKTPWVRVGKKGSVRVYKFKGQRTTRIKGPDGSMICEVLSKGTQIVLPPSIHPDTGRPYTATTNLYEVIENIPNLPMHFEDLIRGALKDIGIDISVGNKTQVSVFVPAGARDNAMVAHAGILARAVTRGERTLLEALGEMDHWVDNFVEKVIGDPVTTDKAQAKVVEFLVRDVMGDRQIALPSGWDAGLMEEDKTRLGLGFTDENEVWTAERILEYLSGEFQRFENVESSGWLQSVDVALSRVAKNGGRLSLMDEDRILRFINAQSKSTITMTVMKRQIAALRKGDILGENHNEIAEKVAEFINQYGEVRFDGGHFWQWRGSHWDRKDDNEILRVIQSEFGFYPACRRLNDYIGVKKSMAVNLEAELRQSRRVGLNFANGFLTEDLELIAHDPDYGMTYTLPYRYLPEMAGHMPMFNQYLMDSWGSDPDFMDKVSALQEAIGVTLFGAAPRFQRAICLIGAAGSGKSRILGILRGLMPPSSSAAIPPHDWNDKFLPAELFGKLINFAGELSENKPIPGAAFKEIIEGATISAQLKNQQPFTFRPMCAHWFASNFNPKTKDTSEGFTRRWLFLEWNTKIAPEKRVIDLDQLILHHEREAIVAWAVLGFERLMKNQEFTLPSSHMVRVDQMAQDNNSVRYFLAECPRIRVGKTKTEGEIIETALHGEYWSFCIATSTAQRVSLKIFHNMMKDLQNDFGFQQVMEPTANGNILTTYKYITTAARA